MKGANFLQDEAMDRLEIRHRNKFFKLKKQAIEHLQLILEDMVV
ncbi:hypothetical protein [Streptococcus uberis]|nr:hypothetical protein [Streptococcus uberis]KKF57799.1 hypothetical protein AF68_09410 [Streptococcus uberis B362]